MCNNKWHWTQNWEYSIAYSVRTTMDNAFSEHMSSDNKRHKYSGADRLMANGHGKWPSFVSACLMFICCHLSDIKIFRYRAPFAIFVMNDNLCATIYSLNTYIYLYCCPVCAHQWASSSIDKRNAMTIDVCWSIV